MRKREDTSMGVAGRATLGLLAGIAGGIAMNQVHAIWSFVAKRVGEQPPTGESEGEPATVKVAEELVGPLDDERKAHASSIAHYVMSAVSGVIYAFARTLPIARAGRGAAYGAAVWAVADETMVPALHLSAPPWRFPVRSHVRALLAHLVYGTTVDLSLRLMGRAAGALHS